MCSIVLNTLYMSWFIKKTIGNFRWETGLTPIQDYYSMYDINHGWQTNRSFELQSCFEAPSISLVDCYEFKEVCYGVEVWSLFIPCTYKIRHLVCFSHLRIANQIPVISFTLFDVTLWFTNKVQLYRINCWLW